MEKTTTEVEIRISEGRIIDAVVLDNSTCKLTVQIFQNDEKHIIHEQEKKIKILTSAFCLIEASKLSLNDDFMKYKPITFQGKKFKESVESAICSGLKDFYCSKYDPSLDDNGNICYVPNKKPATGFSYQWWKDKAKTFMPERESCLGSERHRVALLAVLLKKLVEDGYSNKHAWSSICNDSIEMGHYWNSKNAKRKLELTGSREICGFYDLANTGKILKGEDDTYYLTAGGNYVDISYDKPLTNFRIGRIQNISINYGVGWIILNK